MRKTLIGLVVGMLATMMLTPAGAIADNIKDVFVTNTASDPVPTDVVGTVDVSGDVGVTGPVDVSGSDVTVANLPAEPQPWDTVVQMDFAEGAKFSFESLDLPDDRLITIERVAIGDFFSNPLVAVRVVELCDFTDGKSGFGGQIAVPVGPTLEPGTQGIDHLTAQVITPGACVSIALELQTALGSSVSGFTTLTLSGSQIPIGPSTAAFDSESHDDALMRSLDDPLVAGVLSPEQLEHARASVRDGSR